MDAGVSATPEWLTLLCPTLQRPYKLLQRDMARLKDCSKNIAASASCEGIVSSRDSTKSLETCASVRRMRRPATSHATRVCKPPVSGPLLTCFAALVGSHCAPKVSSALCALIGLLHGPIRWWATKTSGAHHCSRPGGRLLLGRSIASFSWDLRHHGLRRRLFLLSEHHHLLLRMVVRCKPVSVTTLFVCASQLRPGASSLLRRARMRMFALSGTQHGRPWRQRKHELHTNRTDSAQHGPMTRHEPTRMQSFRSFARC